MKVGSLYIKNPDPAENTCHMFSPIPPPLSQDILTQEKAKCCLDNSSMNHPGLL